MKIFETLALYIFLSVYVALYPAKCSYHRFPKLSLYLFNTVKPPRSAQVSPFPVLGAGRKPSNLKPYVTSLVSLRS